MFYAYDSHFVIIQVHYISIVKYHIALPFALSLQAK